MNKTNDPVTKEGKTLGKSYLKLLLEQNCRKYVLKGSGMKPGPKATLSGALFNNSVVQVLTYHVRIITKPTSGTRSRNKREDSPGRKTQQCTIACSEHSINGSCRNYHHHYHLLGRKGVFMAEKA